MSTPQYQMVIVWSDKERCYLVHLPDFPEQSYQAQGNSYAEAAKNGEELLQRLERSASALEVVAEQCVGASPAVISEAAVGSIKSPISETVGLEDGAIASQLPGQETPPFPVLKTTFVSVCTSIVAVTVLTALTFISEGLTASQPKTLTPSSTEKSDTLPEEGLRSKTSHDLEPGVTPAADAKKDSRKDANKDSNSSTTAASPLTLANSITESSAVWAIATYTDEGRNINLIVSGEETGLITIRDQGSGEPIRTIEAHEDKVRAIAIAPNTRRLISSSGDGIKAWNLETGKLLYHLPSSVSVWSIAIAPDESRFISGANDGTLAAWDLETGQPLYSTDNGAIVWSVAVSPEGQSFVSGDSNRAVRQWDLATGQPLKTFTGHQSDVRAVAISPDGKTLASGSWDKTVKLWSLETGKLKATLEGHQNHVVSLAISSDSSTLASGSTDTTVKLWNLSNYQLVESLDAHSDWVLATAFKARGQTLITGGKDKTIKIWE